MANIVYNRLTIEGAGAKAFYQQGLNKDGVFSLFQYIPDIDNLPDDMSKGDKLREFGNVTDRDVTVLKVVEGEDKVIVDFESAWGAPIDYFDNVSEGPYMESAPKVRLTLEWADPALDRAGRSLWMYQLMAAEIFAPPRDLVFIIKLLREYGVDFDGNDEIPQWGK